MKANSFDDLWKYVERRQNNECWPWIGAVSSNGYGKARKSGRGTRLSHRLIYEAAFEKPPTGVLVLHRCGNKVCCNPAHLYLGDHAQNAVDAIQSGIWTSPPSKGCPRGVFPYRKGYRAAATHKGRWTLLYQGLSFEEACCARKSWEAQQLQ